MENVERGFVEGQSVVDEAEAAVLALCIRFHGLLRQLVTRFHAFEPSVFHLLEGWLT